MRPYRTRLAFAISPGVGNAGLLSIVPTGRITTRENLPEVGIPRERWILFSHQVIWHGRKLCFARKPKCAECALENICHAGDKTWSTVEMHKNAVG